MTDPVAKTPLTSEEHLQLWLACKQRIATCRDCLNRWPALVEQTLTVNEIPNPRREIGFLFVGVAPPPIGSEEDDEPGHFYSDPCDRLRLGLFHVLDHVFSTDLTQRNRVSREAGTTAFLDAGFFFVHAAKVRPSRGKLAPGRSTMRFCAKRHLGEEVELLKPQAICFLGATNAAPAAEAVFGRRVGEVPEQAEIRRQDGTKVWEGWTAVAVQPVRGTKEGRNRERAARVIEKLREALKARKTQTFGTPRSP